MRKSSILHTTYYGFDNDRLTKSAKKKTQKNTHFLSVECSRRRDCRGEVEFLEKKKIQFFLKKRQAHNQTQDGQVFATKKHSKPANYSLYETTELYSGHPN